MSSVNFKVACFARDTYRGPVAEKTYHHGDLRTALIDEALRLIETRGADDISLREVARGVGVSATAVYRHFPDKKALLTELARAGLDRLAAHQRAASEAAGGGIAGFFATGGAYIRFALANPGLYRMIFAHPADHDPLAIVGSDRDDAMTMLQESAAAYAPPGTAPRLFALQSWAMVHGLSMLALDGQVRVDDALIDAVVDSYLLAATRSRA